MGKSYKKICDDLSARATSATGYGLPGVSALVGTGGVDYATEVLADSPVIYVKGADGTGDDSSGNGYNMVETSAISGVTRSGFPESSVLDLTTADRGLELDQTALRTYGDVTIEAWVEFQSLPADGSLMSIGYYGGNAIGSDAQQYNSIWHFSVQNTGGTYYLNAFHENGAGANNFVQSVWSGATTGQVYHMVQVRDTTANEYKIYIDGALVATLSYTNEADGGTDAGARLNFGMHNNSSTPSYLDGYISSMAVYHSVLTHGRIATHYVAGKGTS